MPMWNWLRMDKPDPLCTLGMPGKDSANSCTDSKQSFYFKQNSCASGILSRFTSKSGEYQAPSWILNTPSYKRPSLQVENLPEI